MKQAFPGRKKRAKDPSLILHDSWATRPKRKKATHFTTVIKEDMRSVREKLGCSKVKRKRVDGRPAATAAAAVQLELKWGGEDKGHGMFASDAIARGHMVIEYKGDLINEQEAHERELQYGRQQHCYMYYFAWRGKRMCLDATDGDNEHFGLARYINHSRRTPNVFPRLLMIDGVPRLALFAGRRIDAGEELMFDYGDRRKEIRKENPWLNS